MTSKRKDPEEGLLTLKIIGRILLVLALPILIINAVLLNMENKNLGIIGLMIGFAGCMTILGAIMVFLPHEHPPTMKHCSFCGVKNEEDAVHCKKCGKKIS